MLPVENQPDVDCLPCESETHDILCLHRSLAHVRQCENARSESRVALARVRTLASTSNRCPASCATLLRTRSRQLHQTQLHRRARAQSRARPHEQWPAAKAHAWQTPEM